MHTYVRNSIDNMKSLRNHLISYSFSLLPYHSSLLYGLFKQYVDRFNGENDDNLSTNGEERFAKQALPKCRLIFDVGANIGDWTKLALSINPTLSIHCFEPSHFTYQKLVANALPPNVTCNEMGLGAAEEER